jgi:ABC-type Zn uptake system ZnuABC Zn-binding protein ZnuA
MSRPKLLALALFGVIVAARSLAYSADQIRVVATTNDLASVARAVGGDNVEVTTLARPTEDPHFVDGKPSFIRVINQADVLVEGGADLEAGWLPPLIASGRNARVALGSPGRVVASQGLSLLDVPAVLDRSMGDIHPYGNPHFMLDPTAAEVVAQSVAASYCAVDPERCSDYERNLSQFRSAIDARMPVWQAALDPFKGQKVVTYHKDYDYFLRRFGLVVAGTLEPKPGIPPSPTYLATLIPRMKIERVRLILIEPFRERSNPDFVAEATGAQVLVLPTIPSGEHPDYIGHIDSDVRLLAEALHRQQGSN